MFTSVILELPLVQIRKILMIIITIIIIIIIIIIIKITIMPFSLSTE